MLLRDCCRFTRLLYHQVKPASFARSASLHLFRGAAAVPHNKAAPSRCLITSSLTSEMAQDTDSQLKAQPYAVRPLPGSPFAVEVVDFDLTQPVTQATIDHIKQDVSRHHLVVFRGQGVVSGSDQVRISSWFGELESTFYKHPKSPDPDVFRVSNDEHEGCTGVGRTGWHIDGSFMAAPFSHSVYHIVSVPRQGSTVFVPMFQLLQALPPEQRQKWDRLYMVSDRRSSVIHPLIYQHPETGQPTMCFHTGMTDLLVWDAETDSARRTKHTETLQLLEVRIQESDDMFCICSVHSCSGHRLGRVRPRVRFPMEIDGVLRGPIGKSVEYEHRWQPGDFILTDNLAVAHEAHPTTQLPVSKVGLRVMHRCTIKGTHVPQKSAPMQGR